MSNQRSEIKAIESAIQTIANSQNRMVIAVNRGILECQDGHPDMDTILTQLTIIQCELGASAL